MKLPPLVAVPLPLPLPLPQPTSLPSASLVPSLGGQASWVSVLEAVLLFSGGILAAVLTLLGVLFSQRAPLQKAANDALRLFMEESQTRHAQDGALILRQEGIIAGLRLDLLQKDGDIRNLRQNMESLLTLQRKAGLPQEIFQPSILSPSMIISPPLLPPNQPVPRRKRKPVEPEPEDE